MQVKLVCTDFVALARSRPDRHFGKSHCQAFANVSLGTFLSVGGGSKALGRPGVATLVDGCRGSYGNENDGYERT